MKRKYMFLAIAVLCSMALNAADLTGKRIYVNPGHGSFGPNDRPAATIPYPNLPTTGMPDTCGFYESNTDLWKCMYLGKRLEEAGAFVMYSRTACGPWPYQKINGDYPGYSYADYSSRPDFEKYNRNLTEICEEVEANNFDLFLSVHSNAGTEGSTSNYPLWLYRGNDARSTDFEKECYKVGAAIWPYRYEMMAAGYDPASAYASSMNLRGDINFYGSSSTRTSAVSGKKYTGYLGVLKHGAIGGLYEGYFHTYQPARHRALNHEHCHMEGYDYYRGIIDYFGADKDTKGYILGTVKDLHEKIVHRLFNYAPKTNDQWLPCNGAVVTLYKAGVKVGEYQVDTLYNGIFYFGDLEPGSDYTLDATCEGYKPLFDEYKAPLTVKANTVIHPFIFLEDEEYESSEMWKTYPDPDMPEYRGVADKYVMNGVYADEVVAELAGKTIRRSIVRSDNTMFVLAIDDAKNPYLYLIDPGTHTIKAQLPTDFCTVSSEGNLRLSDIAVTAEGVLIGCNEEKVTFYTSNKWLVYKWTETAGVWTGSVWINTTTSETAGNYYDAMAGTTLAYAGSLEDGMIYSLAYTIGSDTHGVRYFAYSIAEDAYAGAFRNQNADHNLAAMGHDIQFVVSPESDDKVIITAGNIAPMEWTTVTTTGSAPIIKNMPATFTGVGGVSFFKYAHHNLMLVPDAQKQAGVAMYDITEGVDAPKEIEIDVTGATVANPALYATAIVNNAEITVYQTAAESLSKLTTANVSQPAVANIYAYDLRGELNEEGTEYTFSWKANATPVAGYLVFYQEGQEVGRTAITSLGQDDNSMTLNLQDIPCFSGTETTWGVELRGHSIPNIGIIHNQPLSELGITRAFCAVDNSPESDYFGRIYISDRAGANLATSGLHAFNQDYTRINTSVLKGGRAIYGSPYQIYVDDQGYIWISDGSDGYSGIFIADPANLEGEYEEFFNGATRNGVGMLTLNGQELGSSCLGLTVYGTSENAKLLSYNEDGGALLPKFGLAIYNIGTTEGTYLHEWTTAPSQIMSLTGQSANDGYPLGCSHGVWVAQRADENSSSKSALNFYDWSGNELFTSAVAPYKNIINGNASGACAITPDESMLVMIDGSKNLLFFDIVWEGDKPTLNLKYEYACGMTDIREMHFDYAGNLVTSGENNYFRVFTIPQGENVTTTPAKKSLTFTKPFSGEVEGVILDQYNVSVERGGTMTLVATVMPHQSESEVVWSSDNESVATVENGVVTALAIGHANITVTTVEGEFTATCAVDVIVSVEGITLDKTEANIYKGEYLTLTPVFTPDDATNKNVTWSSSDESIATVTNGVVKGVGVGTAQITAKTADGGFTAVCEITVASKVRGVKLNLSEVSLYVDETATLVATITPIDATNQNVTWSSSDESVVTVQNGVVTAVAAGEASIIVTTEDGGYTAECKIVVMVKVTGIELDQTSIELNVGHTITLTATVTPVDATNKEVIWETANETIATVEAGLVTAVAEGETTIKATTVDGEFTATCAVTVLKDETGLTQLAVNGIYYRGNVIYNEQNLSLRVYDVQGREVAAGTGNIDMSGMAQGVYVVTTGNFGVKIMR